MGEEICWTEIFAARTLAARFQNRRPVPVIIEWRRVDVGVTRWKRLSLVCSTADRVASTGLSTVLDIERRRARYLFRSTAAPPSSDEIGQWTISVERRWSSMSDWFANTTESPIAFRKEVNERLIFISMDLRWFLKIHLDNNPWFAIRVVLYRYCWLTDCLNYYIFKNKRAMKKRYNLTYCF